MLPKTNNILFKGPYKCHNTFIYKILDKKNKENIQITTPNIYINSYNREYSSILISCDDINLENSFYLQKFLKEIENKIIKNNSKLFDKIKKNNKHKFISCLKQWNGNHYITSSLYNNQIQVYDKNKNLTILEKINKNTLAKMIIWLKDITISNDKYYLTLNVMQIRILDPLPPIGCIIESDLEIKKKILENKNLIEPEKKSTQILDKYDKMLKMGVPLHVVNMRRNMDQKNQSNNKLNLLGGLNSIQLKKTEVITKKKIYKSDNWGPSLEEILNSKNKLRKIN